MPVVLVTLGAPDAVRRRRLLVAHGTGRLSYDEVGGTELTPMPAGYRHDDLSVEVGHGDAAFARARHGIDTWQAQLGAGVDVSPRDPPAEGRPVLAIARLGPVRVIAPCRVVDVIDEPDRYGFAYGTLPGHPERGEEAFVIERSADGTVLFRVRAFSRPADRIARLGAPVTRAIQLRALRAYLAAMRAYVHTP
jgi:uncharacterized protein (UPF0548 family)